MAAICCAARCMPSIAGGELREAIDAGTARVVEQNGSDHRVRQRGRLLCSCSRRDHQGLEAMIGASPAFPGPLMQTTLITVGLYNEPARAYPPSVLY
jgi:hypothetical protein